MQLSKQQIEEFRVIYTKEFGKTITEEDALEMATRLINLYQLIHRPLPGEPGYSTTPPSEETPSRDVSCSSGQ